MMSVSINIHTVYVYTYDAATSSQEESPIWTSMLQWSISLYNSIVNGTCSSSACLFTEGAPRLSLGIPYARREHSIVHSCNNCVWPPVDDVLLEGNSPTSLASRLFQSAPKTPIDILWHRYCMEPIIPQHSRSLAVVNGLSKTTVCWLVLMYLNGVCTHISGGNFGLSY